MRGAVAGLLLLWAAEAGAQTACPPEPVAPTPAQVQQAAQQARNRGALWRFSKDGRHGYLYGTVHVGKLEWAIPGSVVARALRESDTIAVEARVLDPAFQASMKEAQKPADTPALATPLLARLRAQAAKLCAPWESLQAMPPMMIVMTLTVLEGRWDGLYPDYGVEIVLEGFAKAAGKDVVALETSAVQRGAVMGGSSAEQLAAIEAALIGMENGTARRQLAATANAWARGDLEAVIAPVAQLSTAERTIVERVIGVRNPGLAARIDELHQSGRRLFATAGILHMVGDNAVPKLLAARGYSVERLAFDDR